ncbi:hypothetical protein BS78_K314900 [Paspalum vaginatum]|uniref:Uncharacterized protein n=1 Tax=Paspalum vaginatum TaxID=158149 RepID=A0A9W7XA45_9POAL|nr:hypothetical protein BS78_K314900 [Paspalum vaginatum]
MEKGAHGGIGLRDLGESVEGALPPVLANCCLSLLGQGVAAREGHASLTPTNAREGRAGPQRHGAAANEGLASHGGGVRERVGTMATARGNGMHQTPWPLRESEPASRGMPEVAHQMAWPRREAKGAMAAAHQTPWSRCGRGTPARGVAERLRARAALAPREREAPWPRRGGAGRTGRHGGHSGSSSGWRATSPALAAGEGEEAGGATRRKEEALPRAGGGR